MSNPEIGESIKVFLPGESPWATVIAVNQDGSCQARIDNRLTTEMSDIEQAKFMKDWFGTASLLPRKHNFKFGDVVNFKRTPWPNPQGFIWEPMLPN